MFMPTGHFNTGEKKQQKKGATRPEDYAESWIHSPVLAV